MATAYTNPGGTGRRGHLIIVSGTGLGGGYSPQAIVGADWVPTSNCPYGSGAVAGKYIRFQFSEAVLIDECKWYQNQTTSNGVWKWQGSNDATNWTDIGSSFTLGGGLTQTQTQLNGNTTKYIYYQLLGVSGSFAVLSTFINEAEFKIDVTDQVKTYLNSTYSYGNRTGTITVSSDFLSANPSGFVDGLNQTNYTKFSGTNPAGHYIKFDFGTALCITEAIYFQQNTTASGTWKWQGSNDESNWIDIGSPFSLGGATREVLTELSTNVTEYRYYRLLGTGGTTNTSVYLYEFIFQISSVFVELPTVITNAASDVSVNTATGNGEVTDDGGGNISERGFCWSTSANPTTADDTVTVSGTVGSYSETISSLTLGTLYFYRAYAINEAGTAYGNDVTFTTIGYPNVVTNAVTDIGIDAAIGHGSNDSGGGTITERGLCWGTSADPDTVGDHVTASGTTGAFSGNLTGLSVGTHYFVRAYATNSEVGTAYGDNVEFTTIALPVVETLTASDVTAISAAGNGNVTSAGGGTISERGFVWSLTANPTTADNKLVVAGTTGAFSGAITGLTQVTTYHYRAYAINEAGTAYGDDLIILTTAGLPVISTGTVTTGDVTNINNVSSIAHGNVLSDGGSTITSRGICYALTDTPTLLDSVATATGTLGEFTATLTGLVKGTTYYYRAFATNAAGTAYGGIAHFVAGFESGIVTPTPATPKTIFPELPPKLRFKLDDEYPGFYYWYSAAKKFWSTVSFKGGSFTLSVGTSTIVADARTLATSVVVMHPTNAAAAALTPYVSAKTAGTGFTLTHGIAAGTETFDYILYV